MTWKSENGRKTSWTLMDMQQTNYGWTALDSGHVDETLFTLDVTDMTW